MAELFGYTPSQVGIESQAPTIQIRPNMQAANAFQALGDLYKTAQQAQADDIQRQSAETQAAMSYVRTAQAIAAGNIKAEQDKADALAKQRKEEEKIYEDALFINTGLALKTFETDFNNAYASAGDNIQARAKALAQFEIETNDMFERLPLGVQTRVQSEIRSVITAAKKTFATDAQKDAESGFYADMHLALPTYLSQSPEQRKADYERLKERATALGLPLKDVGDKYVSGAKDVLMSSIAAKENDIVVNNDVSSINDALAVIDELDSLDGRNASVIESAREELNGIKTKVFNNVKSQINGFISVSDKDNFDTYIDKGLEMGAFTQVDADQYEKEFTKTYISSGKSAQRRIEALSEKTNGMFPTSFLTDKDKSLGIDDITTELKKQFSTGTVNLDYVNYHANINPKVYSGVYKEFYEEKLGGIKLLAQKASVEKDPAKAQELRGEVFNQVRQLNNLKAYSQGTLNSTDLLKATMIETVVTSGDIVNIPEALKNIDELGEFKTISITEANVKQLRKDLPDQQVKAQRLYSALVAAGVNKDQAYKSVKNSLSSIKVDGNRSSWSGAVNDKLTSAGLGEKAKEKFEEELLNPENGIPQTKIDDIEKTLKGTNPSTQVDGNNLRFSNDEGDTVYLPMSDENVERLVETINTKYQDENVMMGVFRLGYDGAVAAGQKIYKDVNEIVDLVTPAAKVVEGAGVNTILIGKTVKDMTVSIGSNINTWIDNWAYQDMDPYKAKDIMLKGIKKDWNETKKYNKAINAEVDKSFQEAVQRADRAIDLLGDDLYKSGGNAVVKAVEIVADVLNSIIPEAEGADVVPEGGYMGQKGVTVTLGTSSGTPVQEDVLDALLRQEAPDINNIVEGATHMGQEGGDAETTNYGVRIKDFKKLENESDREHALRYYKTKFEPYVDGLNVKGIDKVTLSTLAWNMGTSKASPVEKLRNKDMTVAKDRKRVFSALLGAIGTDNNKAWSAGLHNSRIRSWNKIADGVDEGMKIESYKVYKSSGKTYIQYNYENGGTRTLYTTKPLHSDSKMTYNKEITVK